jgi:small ligand-binding sensory domain FIST
MSELFTSRAAPSPDPESARRWAAVGHSVETDAFAAGSAAASAALVGDDPKLLVVFCSDSYDLPQLLAAIAGQAPGTPLIGCTTAGEIATGTGHDHERGRHRVRGPRLPSA